MPGPDARLSVIWRDKWLIIAAFFLLAYARVTLSLFGFGDTRKECKRTARKPVAPPALANRIARSMTIAARFVPASTCLVRAMAGQRLLSIKNHGSEICVGVRKKVPSGFEAHAWLVSGSAVVLGGVEEDLAQFQTLIGTP